MKVKKLTKVNALMQLIKEGGGQVSWTIIYQKIGAYYPEVKCTEKEGLTEISKAGIRGVLYRDCDKGRNIFTKIGEGTFALKAAK